MKKQYTAPSLTVIAISMERGYAASIPLLNLSSSDSDDPDTEVREVSTHWTYTDEEGFWEETY